MTGLIMGMGMTTDASIVILENVYSYRERGAKPEVAAVLGSREMMRAIITSTVTTLCVFVPLIIFKNDLKEYGLMYSDLIFTVVISLTISLIVAITLVPSLSGAVLKLHTRNQKPIRFPPLRLLDNILEKFFRGLEDGYKGLLRYCLSHRAIILLLVLLVLIYSFLQMGSIGMNMNVRMRVDDNVNINVSMPQGTAIDVTEKVLFDIEDLIKKEVVGYRNIILTARRTGTNQGTIQITLPPPVQQIDTPDTIIRKLTPHLGSFPGTRISFRAGRGMGSTSAVEIAVSSKNYDLLVDTATDIQNIIIRHLPEVENPVINLDEGAPQLQIEIDRDRAANFGLSLTAIASEIRTAMDGYVATTMSRGDRLLNVQVRLREQDRTGVPNLDAIFVMSRNGTRVSLSNVAKIVEGRAPSSIRREKQERVLRVTGDLAGGIAATEFQRKLIETVNNNLVKREGVNVRFLGEAYEIQSSMKQYIFIIAIAIFLIFGVMASQFESFVDPLIIFFSIPLLFIGVIWIYRFTGQAMTMFSVIGIIACVGVVVNTGIVLVDYTNTLRARGMSVRDACLEAGRRRLRPILMSSFTTILSMAPIAFFPGAGADSIQPIGKTFVGGLTVSTLMALFVIPIMYSVLNARHDKVKAAKTAPPALLPPALNKKQYV
jgi:HAE1 family hydrophobic/amphiphilic exporter-1